MKDRQQNEQYPARLAGWSRRAIGGEWPGCRAAAAGRGMRGVAAVCGCALALATAACGHATDPPAATVAPDPFNAPAPRPGKPLPPAPPASDGSIALQRMVAAYKKLGSLQQTSEADITAQFGLPVQAHQVTVLKYQRDPARVALILKDPIGGKQEYIGDGSTMVQYMGLTNQFVRRTAGPSMSAMVRIIDRDAPQGMSPLIFLTSEGVPGEVASSRLVGAGSVEGKKAVVVAGTLSDAYLRRCAAAEFAAPVRPLASSFTLWLDASTYLLLKSSVHMGWRGKTTLRGSAVRFADPRVDYTETVRELVQNPRFTADDFRFVPPPNAKEKFVEQRESE